MKTIQSFCKLFFTLLILGSSTHLAAQIKLGDNGTTMSPYALLELESTDKGLLLPRMTSEERDAAFGQETPAGMVIFNTDENTMQYFFVETDPNARAVGEKTWKALEDIGVPVGTEFPETPDLGSLFYETETETLNLWNGSAWIDFISLNRAPVAAPQTLALAGNTLSISDGNSITLPAANPVVPAAANPQTLALVGTTLTISNGNSITLPATSSGTPTSGTDSQTLTVSGTTLIISNGNSVSLPITASVTPTSGTDSQTLVYGNT
ncbi:hypothetical protein OAC51_05070, partial [Flavobacteriaceae bacterium]|nr:hypothetical protein [Flavobacteriaceae bacterium]